MTTLAFGSTERILFISSMPSNPPGSAMSSRTRSGRCATNSFKPSSPVSAPEARYPSSRSEVTRTSTTAGSSSITRILAVGNFVITHYSGAAGRRPPGTRRDIEAAKDKAYSAVLYRRPTKVFQDLVGQGGPNLRLLRLAGASPLEGGIPLVVDGKIIGAVGVSGATSEQDAQVAKAGADALTK